MEISEKVKQKLADCIELWADETLENKPTLLAQGVYFNMCNLLQEKTNQILDTFKDN